MGFLGRWGTCACPQCLPNGTVPIRSWTRTFRLPAIVMSFTDIYHDVPHHEGHWRADQGARSYTCVIRNSQLGHARTLSATRWTHHDKIGWPANTCTLAPRAHAHVDARRNARARTHALRAHAHAHSQTFAHTQITACVIHGNCMSSHSVSVRLHTAPQWFVFSFCFCIWRW